MIRDQVRHHVEPEIRQLGQHAAFARDRVGHDDVVGGQPVRRHDQQVTVVNAVDVAHFAARDPLQTGNVGLEQGVGRLHIAIVVLRSGR